MAALAALAAFAVVATITMAAAIRPRHEPAGFAPVGYSSGTTRVDAARDNFFDAPVISVPVGGTVDWENTGHSPHTVTADDGSFDSRNLAPGAEYIHTFSRSGAYEFYCRYHGAPGGIGMAGVVLVGNATLTSPSGARVGRGREPVPTGQREIRAVPGSYSTIQKAVNAARPGDVVLISPGIYREAVRVTTPYLTLLGLHRNDVILDGGFSLANGVEVIDADGVSIENITARHYQLNGFFWTGVQGYVGSYLTAYDDGDYGLYAFDSVYGRFDHSYASGHPDSGLYIGQCHPCHAVIDDVVSEDNGIGYSGTNAGGDLRIVNSVWRNNQGGIVPNTLDSEELAPQDGAYIAGNRVYDNNNSHAPAKQDQASALGTGILLAGGNDNVVERNVVWNHDNYGIAVFPNIDRHFWIASGNTVRGNVVRGSGRADLLLSGPAGDHNCFSGNDFHSSLPPAIQVIHGCGFSLDRLGGGDLSGAIQTLGYFIRAQTGHYPRGDWHTAPPPPPQPNRNLPTQFQTSLGSDGRSPRIVPSSFPLAVPGGGIPGPPPRLKTYPIPDPPRRLEVTVLGVSLAAPTWWSLLLATYAYLLPLILYVAWVSIAMWDLIRQEARSNGSRLAWMAVVLIVPLLGPVLYYVVGRSAIPRSLRTMLVAGGLAIYIALAVLAIAIGGS